MWECVCNFEREENLLISFLGLDIVLEENVFYNYLVKYDVFFVYKVLGV